MFDIPQGIIHDSYFSHHKDKLDLYSAAQHHSPVSSILLQENRFSPLSTAGFFFARYGFSSPLRLHGIAANSLQFQSLFLLAITFTFGYADSA
ncbi:MAG TPA: hypothetical protein VGP06_12955 [Janthinobacterium sp.]|nr:hypothetical protein [Janthinobacterium sp.]